MVDLTLSGPPQPPACRNGTISGYARRLIFFFFNLINNFKLEWGEPQYVSLEGFYKLKRED
ncbi:hypothetical protein ANCCAN_10983 [Ancylostoma caninum]|uniref:Uncharacterized protein n=1 Tax=Ancylostoma caninum TaxID=29170 RepID=A0A368GF60_ANCCA|nr:hypothetical protein ANCCAN_10983 [Ancylostoma caninum]